MPLEVKNVEWNETENTITLKVPLQGASTKNVDIFSSNRYIKVSFPPYYYEVGLFEEINDDTSKATISNGQISFHLQKCSPRIWGQIQVSEHKDKAFMRDLRDAAIKDKQTKEQERDKLKAQMKDQQKKFAVREQMRVDSEERQKRKQRKEEEMKVISEDMEQWKINNNNSNKTHTTVVTPSPDSLADDGIDSEDCDARSTSRDQAKAVENIIKENNEKNKNPPPIQQKEQKDTAAENESQQLPEPRSVGSIQVNFTPRKLATPARESKLPEEELWLKKVAEMNKMKSVENKDDVTDMEEMNPVWLKDKGNDFFKKGNFVAAINAYTSALILDSSIPMLYANRAACHLSLKQHRECIQDCSNALELYEPPVEANAMSRCRAYTRRGTAYYQLEQYVNALRDYEAAIKLDPQNKSLRTDAFKIRRTLQGGDSSD